MKGTRPLDNDESRRVSAGFTGTFTTRNRGLFMLSLRIGDVYQNWKLATQKYIGVSYATAREVVEAMAFGAESYRTV